MLKEKNISLFVRHGVLSESEIHSRYDILLENYCKVLHIEAMTMTDMADKQILPAVSVCLKKLCDSLLSRRAAVPEADCSYEEQTVRRLSALSGSIHAASGKLKELAARVRQMPDHQAKANACHEVLLPAMADLRAAADEAETLVGEKDWPFPTYGDLLFGVR